MATNKTLKAIQADIEDELGMDVYRVVPSDERRFIGEALVMAVATAVLIDYMKALLQPKEAGEAHRSVLNAVVDRIVRKRTDSAEAVAQELEGDALKALEEVQGAASDPVAAKAKLVEGLRGLELSEAEADALADRLAASIERHLAKTA